MRALLAPAELLYRGVNRVRRALYRRGVLKPERLHRPVISVGNIAAGGTGKTPAVIALARFLASHGIRVAVLTRGHGRADGSVTGTVTDLDADKFGDEPVLIKRSTNVDVIVGVKRYELGRRASCDVFLLDDGFQHLQLERDLDIVIDAPSRFYREGRSALRAASFVIPRDLRMRVPDSLRGRQVFAFAGLADNEQFFDALRNAGLDVTGARSFPDHHRYTRADVDALRRDAGAAVLVTTEKDAVKLKEPDIVAVAAEFVMAPDVLERALEVARAGQAASSAPERRRKRRKHPVVQRLEYVLYRLVTRTIAAMSDDRVLRWGARLGTLARTVLRGRDRLGMRNLQRVFPERGERERRRILNECWRHFGREALLYLKMQNMTLEQIAARCSFAHADLIRDGLARGSGTILISAHWGGWEAGGLALLSLFDNVRMVARPLDNELLERDLQRLRANTGAEVVDRRKAARFLLRALAENAVVVLLPDQAVLPREGVLVPFLGLPAWTTAAPAKMAIRADATIVFGFCIPDGLRHRLEFEEPIRAGDFASDENGAEKLTTRINEVLSRRIAAQPELWLWMHDRWKWTGESDVKNGV
jgi:tetraacyldisaccharide 4'-kinase